MIVSVLVLFAAAAYVRIANVGSEDFWGDEIHSLADSAARGGAHNAVPYGQILHNLPRYTDLTPESTVPNVWRDLANDIHPPLYYVMLNLWRRWLGSDEATVRLLPTIFSLLAIAPLAMIFVTAGRYRLGQWSVIVSAFAFASIYVAQTNRTYSLALMWVNLSFWLVIWLERRWSFWSPPRRVIWAVVYGLTLLAAMLSHYFCALPLVAQAVYVLWRIRGRTRIVWLATVLTSALAWCVIWGPGFLIQRDRIERQTWILETSEDYVMRAVKRGADVPMRLLFKHPMPSIDTLRSIAGAGILLACLWKVFERRRPGGRVTSVSSRGRTDNDHAAREGSHIRVSHAAAEGSGERVRLDLLFVLWYALPIGTYFLVDALSARHVLTHPRFISFALPGLIGLLVLAVDRLPQLGQWIALTVFALGVAITLDLPAVENPHARRAAELVDEVLTPDALLIYDAIDWPHHWPHGMYELITHYLPEQPRAILLLHQQADEALLGEVARYPRLIVVCPRPDDIPNPLPDSYEFAGSTSYIHFIGWVHLFVRQTHNDES
jgi:hypothetical protein